MAALTDKYGGLKGWQWIAIGAGTLAIGYYIIKARQQNAASTPGDSTNAALGADAAGPLPGATQLAPIIIQQGPASQPVAPKPTIAEQILAKYGKFITTTQYKTLPKTWQAWLYPLTTKSGAHGYGIKGTPLPPGARYGFVTIPKTTAKTR